MSETYPAYVPCAAGANAFGDCLVLKHGDLIRLVGHAQMDFVAEDAKRLAYAILDALDDPFQPAAAPPSSESGDAIVDEARAKLLARSKAGQAKYGATLMRNDLDLIDWLRHAAEEGMDQTLYLLRAIKDLEKLCDDSR